ncbi:methionine/alanine import family NSS transporter small subunit [Shewanella eurypsychrophilus]|uniref:Methionine/alanine import family NSS transporter small subunit n=1 Tax=Shewanella eurypsychrophilus TaxID=2593656 RepID=A0ABX6VB17_9GAMM|nr:MULTISPECIES: methionine/alanine import family NSS transporter small subunit [Shewanella]QFU23995.1 methionine/alanine import family NSS transporter small subunit [Shewanella sp. YLB-09]QPG59208.1 methionine/alanine import family NSS transporter small subunit [Shewanella eurypsychrophilus]
MSISAIIMMSLALLITWGGAALCIKIAMKKNKKNKHE